MRVHQYILCAAASLLVFASAFKTKIDPGLLSYADFKKAYLSRAALPATYKLNSGLFSGYIGGKKETSDEATKDGEDLLANPLKHGPKEEDRSTENESVDFEVDFVSGPAVTGEGPAPIPLTMIREKRQFGRQRYPGFQNFGNSASAANAQAQSFGYQGPGGFGSSASASNAASQGFGFGPGGFTGGASQTASQNYNIQGPGGLGASLSYTGGFSYGPGGASASNGVSGSFTGPNGQRYNFGR